MVTAKDPGGGEDFVKEPVPEGMHHAICYGVVDFGTQTWHWENKKVVAHKVLLIWELPDERIDVEKDGEMQNLPRAFSKKYTLSLHQKATLRSHLETWRGKAFSDEELEGFKLKKLIGVNCYLQIIHKKSQTTGNQYGYLSSIVPLKDTKSKVAENKSLYFSFEEHVNIPEGTPEWIVDEIKSAPEWGSGTDASQEDEAPPIDNIPF